MAEDSLRKETQTFSDFSHIIDTRILRALSDLGFAQPTLVQSKAIPLAIEGRDILARARTGSGKTAAYCIPLIQKILQFKSAASTSDVVSGTRALILVPTRELAEQVASQLGKFLSYCEKEVVAMNIASGTSSQHQKMLLAENPDILVATPSRVLSLLQSRSLSLRILESLVIDEADLILSYGHDDDVRQILNGGHLPKVYQSFLMSATMTKDVEDLKGLVLRSPVILKLEEDEDETRNLTQYFVRCSEVDKFLLTYVILKLKLIKGKCILFVNDVDRSYRLKLFLEQFSIKSCVLNSELPLNSRYHIVQEFNKGVYDYIIATDESSATVDQDLGNEDQPVKEAEDGPHEDNLIASQPVYPEEDDVEEEDIDTEIPQKQTGKRKRGDAKGLAGGESTKHRKRSHKKGGDREYGVSRGVDFVDVSCVINFDLPSSSRSYTHRVGRTARAGRTGMALSYVVPAEEWGKNKIVSSETAKKDELVFSKVQTEQAARGSKIKEYKVDMKQVEAFRYRMEDALRAVTRNAIKEARLKEIKSELLNSEKLKAHFEDNPLDLEYLRHDKPLHPTRVQSHMKHVPSYLLPRIAPANSDEAKVSGETGFVPFRKDGGRGRHSSRGGGRGRGGHQRGGSRGGRKKQDPLRKFS